MDPESEDIDCATNLRIPKSSTAGTLPAPPLALPANGIRSGPVSANLPCRPTAATPTGPKSKPAAPAPRIQVMGAGLRPPGVKPVPPVPVPAPVPSSDVATSKKRKFNPFDALPVLPSESSDGSLAFFRDWSSGEVSKVLSEVAEWLGQNGNIKAGSPEVGKRFGVAYTSIMDLLESGIPPKGWIAPSEV